MNVNDLKINIPVASKTSNFDYIQNKDLSNGIIDGGNFVSILPNSLYFKTSNTIRYMLENSYIQWLPNKEYNINSIVSIVHSDINDINRVNIKYLRCIKTNVESTNDRNKQICNIPVSNNYDIDTNGNILFKQTFDEDYNREYWEIISQQAYDVSINYTVNDDNRFEYMGDIDIRDEQIKLLEIFDVNTLNFQSNEYFYINNLNIHVDRLRNIIFEISIRGTKNNMHVSVNNVKYNLLYNAEDQGFIFHEGPHSFFKDVAINGLFLLVNNVEGKVLLGYAGIDSNVYTEYGNSFNISIDENGYTQISNNIRDKGIKLNIKKYISNKHIINNNEYEFIPITNTANNKLIHNVGIKHYAIRLNTAGEFLSGLFNLNKVETDSGTKLNEWLYRLASSNLMYKKNNLIPNVHRRYLLEMDRTINPNDNVYFDGSVPAITGSIKNVPPGTTIDNPNDFGATQLQLNPIMRGMVTDQGSLSGAFKKGDRAPKPMEFTYNSNTPLKQTVTWNIDFGRQNRTWKDDCDGVYAESVIFYRYLKVF